MREGGKTARNRFSAHAERPNNDGHPSRQRMTGPVGVWKAVDMCVSRMARGQQWRGGEKWTASSFSGHRFGNTEEEERMRLKFAHALPENSLTATSGRSLCHAKVQKAHARARCTSRRKEEDQKEEEVEIHIKARDKILRGGKRIFFAAGDKAV